MSDTRYGDTTNGGRADSTDRGNSSIRQQAADLAGGLKNQAVDVAGDVSRQLKEQASQLTESAKSAASGASEKLLTAAEDQKNAGADFVTGLAGAVRRAAGEFDDQLPQAGEYIRRAAAQIDAASAALRQRNLGDLVEEVQNFARRQPTAFLGVTVLAGFAAVRFLKSSTSSRPSGQERSLPQNPAFPPRPLGSENARHPAGAGNGMPQQRTL